MTRLRLVRPDENTPSSSKVWDDIKLEVFTLLMSALLGGLFLRDFIGSLSQLSSPPLGTERLSFFANLVGFPVSLLNLVLLVRQIRLRLKKY